MSAETIFISYSQESPEHSGKVRGLGASLSRDGCECRLDVYKNTGEDWPTWMTRQLTGVDFIICVVTQIYERRFRGEELPDVGLGVGWEAPLIRRLLYGKKLRNDRIFPVFFDAADRLFVPLELQGYDYFQLDGVDGYEALLRKVLKRPPYSAPAVGTPPILGTLASAPLFARPGEAPSSTRTTTKADISRLNEAKAGIRELEAAAKQDAPLKARKIGLAAALMALLVTGAVGIWWFQRQATGQMDKEKSTAAAQRAKEEEAREKEDSPKAIAAATKEHPYENSLGMKFVPVAGTGVLFSIWETRVKDFAAFVKASGYNATGVIYSLDDEEKRSVQAGQTWWDPGFEQTGEHAVCWVTWEDAVAFCDWLTKEERKTGRLSESQSYRLPSDLEWSAAVGLGEESEKTPEARDQKVEGVYPWGTTWPPPVRVGNYAGSEVKTGSWPPSWPTIEGYRDGYAQTSPVGSFEANEKGIYDLGGNVWEWCQDWYSSDQEKGRALRGGSWLSRGRTALFSSDRAYPLPEGRRNDYGFRCVLVVGSSR